MTANVRAYAIDDFPAGEMAQLDSVDMVWDTVAHRTIIAEEVLAPSFREYLKTPVHDPYRSSDGCSVQVDAEVALTNKIMLVNVLAVVVPQAKMPNQLKGILFGQISCINRLRYESIPREFLVAKGRRLTSDPDEYTVGWIERMKDIYWQKREKEEKERAEMEKEEA